MSIVLPTMTVAFAAFCVWLTVRIVNRRERWAKWTLAAVVGLPVLYVASFGPACWITSHANAGASVNSFLFRPLAILIDDMGPVSDPLEWYAGLGAAESWGWYGDEWRKSSESDNWIYSPKARRINRALDVD